MCVLFGLEIHLKLAHNNYVLANHYVHVQLPKPLSLSHPTHIESETSPYLSVLSLCSMLVQLEAEYLMSCLAVQCRNYLWDVFCSTNGYCVQHILGVG